ncbi:MAG: LPS-assembly protein LptD [Paludibacteraceae bacterium]|nr:LPS-assembly protein LptD [Paludibacteraceae bacterium]
MHLRERIHIILCFFLLCLPTLRAEETVSQVHSTPAQPHTAAIKDTPAQAHATAAKDTPAETRAAATSTATQTRATATDTPEQKEDTLAQKWASRTQRADTLTQGTDSLTQGTDSLTQGTDSLAQAAPQKAKKSAISAPIHYQASDSMVMMANGTAYLHGKGDLKYEQMQLTSDYIRMNIDSSQIFAHGVWDSINEEWHGKPVFKDGKDEYETNEITYNIKTQKGYIRHVVTQQGEGYIIADRTKKAEGDVMMMAGGQYTTCDNHEHPHFYLKMTKAKVKPGEYIATGPAYMVVGDVPLPLAIPFGFFPFTNKYSSGLIMPNFGDDYTRGLYLSNLGYYFAICDYLDLQITGDIYTRGTWAIRAQSKYIWRYHFSGALNISYRNDVTSEKGMPDYAVKKNFQVQWTHTQDAKFNPYSSFSASVNFATSGYNRSNINSYYNPNLYSENTKSSTINFTQRFPDSPWTLSASASLTQRTSDSTISLTAPQLSISMSSIYPFKLARQNALKRKGKVGDGKERWYEKIKMSYTMNGQISISAIKEKDFLKSNFLRDWQVGLSHTLPINASFMLFKYLSVTPSINLRDKMYFTRIDRSWDEASQMMAMDTTTGFYNVFDFDVGVSLQTKIYGFYTPLKRLFPNSRVEKFRHVITPRVSFSYHPDFGKAGWGYYGSYDEPVYYKDSVDGAGMKVPTGEVVHRTYSRFSGANAPRGMAATLNFGVENNLEMKVVNRDDTTGKAPYKVVSLIDNLGISGGYNFAADSMNWSNFQVNLRLKFPKLNNYSLNMSTYLDPYMYQLDATGQPIRTNKQYWHNGRFPHWSGFSWNFSYTISNQTIKKWKEQIAAKQEGRRARTEETADSEITPVERNEDGTDKNAKINNNGKKKESEVDDGYVKTEFPWSISINYSLAYAAGSEFDYERMYPKMKWRNSLSLSGNIGLGQGWKVSANMTYNFDVMKLTSCTFNISRDLHCWNMSASINPIGPFKSYTFHIGVNASILSDLKYDKSSNQSTNGRVNWW